MNELYYVYPMYKKGSFHFISKEHIRYLKSNVKIQEIDESVLDNLMWIDGKSILLHPIGYFLLGDKEDMFKQRLKRLEKLLLVKDILGGFDTADSDKISSEFVNVLNKLDLVIVGWLSNDELRQLYDACDVCVCPSRGGGFELNALEAIARGLPTLVPHGMCFLDYLEYTIPVKLERRVRVLPYNPIHVGRGFEVNINDFTDKLFNVVENLEHYKMMARKFSEHIRKQYAWFNVCERLYKILQQYNFV